MAQQASGLSIAFGNQNGCGSLVSYVGGPRPAGYNRDLDQQDSKLTEAPDRLGLYKTNRGRAGSKRHSLPLGRFREARTGCAVQVTEAVRAVNAGVVGLCPIAPNGAWARGRADRQRDTSNRGRRAVNAARHVSYFSSQPGETELCHFHT